MAGICEVREGKCSIRGCLCDGESDVVVPEISTAAKYRLCVGHTVRWAGARSQIDVAKTHKAFSGTDDYRKRIGRAFIDFCVAMALEIQNNVKK